MGLMTCDSIAADNIACVDPVKRPARRGAPQASRLPGQDSLPRVARVRHNPARCQIGLALTCQLARSGRLSLSERPWSSTAPPGEFRPFVPDGESLKEFTIRAVILGALFGLLFGAVTVYVGLRAGLTVSASIPISVLSISILRAFGRSTILENNIVQTTGSAGESLAAGVMFTIPALIFLGFGAEFTFWRIFPLALLGGWLGVLFMVPLRRQLIVKEHGNLSFPEGTACADVLVAGERGGSFAGRVFWGLGLGGVYTFLMNTVQAWTSQPEARPNWFAGASFRVTITSEYLGVGYIIGSRVSGILFAGGIISWLVIMPAIRFYGQLANNVPIYPSTIPIPLMTPDQIWGTYIRPMGAGAVAAAGLITLLRTLPTIFSALKAGLKDVRAEGAGQSAEAESHRPRHAAALGGGRLRADHRHDVDSADLSSDPGRGNALVPQSVCRHLRHRLRLSVCHRGGAHQRTSRQLFQSHQRHEHRHADGHVRDLFCGWLDRAELPGAGADDWRRGVHRGGYRRRDFAGLEDRLPGGRNALLAADGPVDRRHRFDAGHRHHAEPDEQRAREIHSHADSRQRRSPCPRA